MSDTIFFAEIPDERWKELVTDFHYAFSKIVEDTITSYDTARTKVTSNFAADIVNQAVTSDGEQFCYDSLQTVQKYVEEVCESEDMPSKLSKAMVNDITFFLTIDRHTHKKVFGAENTTSFMNAQADHVTEITNQYLQCLESFLSGGESPADNEDFLSVFKAGVKEPVEKILEAVNQKL